MTTSVDVAERALPDTEPDARIGRRRPSSWPVPLLLLGEALALFLQSLGAALSRQGREGLGLTLSFVAMAVMFGSAALVLGSARLTRRARTAAVVCLGVVSTLQWRATNPLLFTGFDELLHVRTLDDIGTSHTLGSANPLLAVSPHYPGLEAVAALLEQAGLPLMAAATGTVLIARLLLVLLLSSAVEGVTGNVRAGGIAVAVYATSQQFFFFNSQFAYQTLAIPFALAAIVCVHRARTAARPAAPMVGAVVCLLATAVTHHVTSALTLGFLLVWALLTTRRPGARRVWLAAGFSLATVVAWSATQWSALVIYFGPVVSSFFTELHGSGSRRVAFSDPTGVATPLWERVAILYYAAGISLIALCVVLPRLLGLRFFRPLRRLPGLRRMPGRPGPPRVSLLLVLLACGVPVTFAARSLPTFGEFANRATSFLFIPFAFLVAVAVLRRRGRGKLTSRRARYAGVLMLTGLYVGGIVLGSGPDWQRLPGPWLASADNRSLDPDTIAAVRWAGENLAPGSRIAADRVSGDLLAADARSWVVQKVRNADAASLYFADTWTADQLATVRQAHLQYLYVDQRWATELPHTGTYFHAGETPTPQQLTTAELTKFDRIPGVVAVYRSGPVVIYDLSGLGVQVQHSGWTGQVADPPALVQVGVGLLLGLAVVAVARLGRFARLRSALRGAGTVLGPPLMTAVCVAGLCVVSVALLAAHLWTGWPTFAVLAGVVVLGCGRSAVRRLDRATDRLVARGVRTGPLAVLLLAVGIAVTGATVATGSARQADVTQVDRILDQAIVR